MGAGAGAAAAIENEPSPRRAAIEKAQAELRREVAVREERRRELEFLEKGGELLDFFSGADSSLPPASPTDPLADQLVSSEVERGYASIALPNGDTLGHGLGNSFFVGTRQAEAGDHDDGACAASEPPALLWESKGRAPRTASTSLRSLSDVNLKRESEGSGGVSGRIVVKGQAYTRRNRPRTNRFGNGYTTTREVEKAVENSATPSFEHKGQPAPQIAAPEAPKENENMVEKNAQPHLVHTALPDTSGNWVGLENAKANNQSDGLVVSLVKFSDQLSNQQAPSTDDSADPAKLAVSCEPEVADCITLAKGSDVKGACTDFHVKEELPLGVDSSKVDQLSSTPCVEESVDLREGSALSQSLKQVLCNSPAAVERENTPSIVVKDESSISMVKEKSLVSGLLGPHHVANSECKNKSSPLVPDSQAQRGADRCISNPSNHAHDSSLDVDDKRFVQLEVPSKLLVQSVSLNSSENKSITTRKTTSTASSGALDLSKGDKAMASTRHLESSRVEVKVEECFSEVGVRPAVDTEVESGHDVKRIYAVSVPQEDIKPEGQSTPVSTGSGRASFRTSGSLTGPNKFPGVVLPWEKERDPNVIAETERHKADLSAKARKAHEDYVIEEAEIIKAGKKETAEWGKKKPVTGPPRRKSHWDFVLEEMAWMANDFMQERLWKMASATQFCRWIAQLKGQSEFQASDLTRRQKKVAHVLANAVNEFWRTVELTMYKEKCQAFSCVNSQAQEISANVKDESEAVPMDVDIPAVAELAKQNMKLSKRSLPVQGYAKRFLRDSLGIDPAALAEAPSTPERISEASSALDLFWEEQFSEESLCYTVPNGAFAAYRYAVETQRALLEAEHEQTLQEHAAALAEAEAQAAAEAVATSDFGMSSMEDGLSLQCLSSPTKGVRGDEDGAQYGLPHSSISKKKRKNILKSNTTPKAEGLSSSGLSHPLSFLGFDSTGGLPSPVVTGKRSLPAGSTPASANVGSIPTKRMRSGTSRQRSLGAASPGSFPSPAGLVNRAGFSSGALNSNHEEVRNLPDCTVSARPEGDASTSVGANVLGVGNKNSFVNSKSKKKKKKHFSGALGSSFKSDGAASVNTGSAKPLESEHHSMYDSLKRKGDQLHVGSAEAAVPGSSADTPDTPASQGQPSLKKAKLSKQASDINLDTAATAVTVPTTQGGSMIANTSTSKLLRQNSNRDRNRKSRSSKVSVGQPAGIGIPWSTIEDQAILALVHDLGQNWELVSDVLSSSSQLKGIFRRPRQCKERHKALMDRLSVGEGGDSPEDPSTSQPHPSTLPGIPKGSARVLLQRLQGPVEEDTLKVHLEHIVRVVQKYRALKPQNEEQKVLVPIHPSHMAAVSQFCNSGFSGGFPNPLELCDLSAANLELCGPSYPMPGPHLPGVLPSGPGMRPTTNGMTILPGASNLLMGVAAMSPSNAAVNAARDVHRLAAMRPFSPEEAQRVRYARAMAAARGLPVPGAPVTASLPMMALPSPNDCAVPMLPGSNSVGMMGGLNRSMSLSRTGLPGMGSPGVSSMGSPTLGNMLPPGGVGMVGAGSSVGSAGVPNQVNLMRRPRDPMVRPGRTNEEQRQIFIQELQHQAAQGSTEAQTALTALNRDLSNPLISAPQQNFSTQQHQNQQQQQYMAARIAKERQQLQQKQRLMQQQLQQQPSLPLALPLQQQQQQQQLHPIPQPQHVLPQQSHLSQHQHLLPQQHALQKPQSQPGPQQPGLSLPSSPMQPMAPPPLPSNHQQHQTLSQSQSQSQQQSQPSGQIPQLSQLSVQSKIQQQPKPSQKHQHLQQPSQALQQQQQPRGGSKGVVRGSMMMQTLPSQPGQGNMLPGNIVLGSQLTQPLQGQAISHSIPGQRSIQQSGPMSIGKQHSQGTSPGITAQAGQIQGQPSQAGAGSQGSVGQQQKTLQQPQQMPLTSKQQQASPPLHPSHSQQPPTPVLSMQQPLSPQAQQSQVAPSQQPQQRRQPQQQPQLQQSGQRRLQQRQPSPSMGVPGAGQLAKPNSSQQGQMSPQVSPQTGHVTYSLGTNMTGSMSMVGTSPGTSLVTSLGTSSTAGVHSTQWKSGQSVPPMSTGIYNLTRGGNSGSTGQIPPLVGNSSGIHMASPNGNSGMSNAGMHVVGMSGLPQSQQSVQGGPGVHGQKAGMVSGTNSRALTTLPQGGGQRTAPPQHHGNMAMSLAMGSGQVKSPVPGSSGVMPVSPLSSPTVGVPQSGSMAFQGSAGSTAGPSTPMANSVPLFGLQPRQSHAGTASLATSAMPQKSAAPTTANSASSGVSSSSPAAVMSPSTAANATIADPATTSS